MSGLAVTLSRARNFRKELTKCSSACYYDNLRRGHEFWVGGFNMALLETDSCIEFDGRKKLLLKCARRILCENHYRALTVDRLAKEAGCSRVTIYKHFADIDDVIMALWIWSTGKRADLAERAALFTGRSRERMTAVLDVVNVVDLHYLEHESIADATKIFERALPERRSALIHNKQRLVSVTTGIARESIGAGDLELRATQTPERIASFLLVLNRRTFRSATVWTEFAYETAIHPCEHRVTSTHLFMDHLGWRLLSRDMNYLASADRMWRELLADVLEMFQHEMVPDSLWKEMFPDYAGTSSREKNE